MRRARPPAPPPSALVLVLQALVAAAAVVLFLQPIATRAGMIAGAVGTGAAFLLARLIGRRLRLPVSLAGAGLVALLGHLAGGLLLEHAPGLGPAATLSAADAATFGPLALAAWFALRVLSDRARVFSVLEVAAIVGSATHAFASHRYHHIDQPRALSDWAWSRGIDPSTILLVLGLGAILAGSLLLLRYQRPWKLLSSLLLLLLLGAGGFLLVRGVRIEAATETNGLGLTGKGEAAGDASKDPFGGNFSKPPTPNPVAVAVLRDDFEAAPDVLYFRQNALSKYDGHHLAPDPAFDRDLIREYPRGEAIRAESSQAEDFHGRLPTSMYLLVDHPQPVALTHALEVRPLANPNPRHFVAAYDVTSAVAATELSRFAGRPTIPAGWSEEQRRHYTEVPDDPRYASLADELAREVDPRFVGDDLFKALAIKRFLEKEGFYTRKENHADVEDPAASFLFGSRRGYCVHFAHAAVYLLRSQGIPARVALGYAVSTRRRAGGSSIMIMGNEAHAWPEIHIDGVGWVTFDIYPERSDEPPPPPIDEDLESLLGELARKDKTGGRAPDPERSPFRMPWGLVAGIPGAALALLLLAAYLMKAARRLAPALAGPPARPRLAYRATLDLFSDLGGLRHASETRERHSARLADLAPSLPLLTGAHLRHALGRPSPETAAEVLRLARAVRAEIRARVPLRRRLLGALHPIGWWFTR